MDPKGVRVQPAKELHRLSCPGLGDINMEEDLADGRAHLTALAGTFRVRVGAGGQDVGEPGDGDGDLLAVVAIFAAQHGSRRLVQGALDDGEGLGRADLGRRRHLADLEVVLLERAEEDGVHGRGGGRRRCRGGAGEGWRGRERATAECGRRRGGAAEHLGLDDQTLGEKRGFRGGQEEWGSRRRCK